MFMLRMRFQLAIHGVFLGKAVPRTSKSNVGHLLKLCPISRRPPFHELLSVLWYNTAPLLHLKRPHASFTGVDEQSSAVSRDMESVEPWTGATFVSITLAGSL